MSELENELRNVLRRQPPPAGFAERVAARVSAAERPAPARRPSMMRWAAAAVLVAALGAGVEYQSIRRERERARGEAAREQVMQALRLAGSKLQKVQTTIKEMGS
jgi:hypothetical protein